MEEVEREGRSRELEIASRGAVVGTSGRVGALLAECGRGGILPACALCPGTPPRKEELAGCV